MALVQWIFLWNWFFFIAQKILNNIYVLSEKLIICKDDKIATFPNNFTFSHIAITKIYCV